MKAQGLFPMGSCWLDPKLRERRGTETIQTNPKIQIRILKGLLIIYVRIRFHKLQLWYCFVVHLNPLKEHFCLTSGGREFQSLTAI